MLESLEEENQKVGYSGLKASTEFGKVSEHGQKNRYKKVNLKDG